MTTFLAWIDTKGYANVQSIPNGNKTTLDTASSNYGPAMAYFQNQLYLAWTGTNNEINLISYLANGTWGEQQTISYAKSNVGPALAASSTLLCLVWTGTNGLLNMIFSQDGSRWGSQITLTQTSGFAPAIAMGGPFQTQALGWTGANGTVQTLSGMNSLAGFGIGPSLIMSNYGPSLAYFENQFYSGVIHTDIDQTVLLYKSSDGLNWNSAPSPGVTSKYGMALAASSPGAKSLLTLVGTNVDGALYTTTSSNGLVWGIPIQLDEITQKPPAIAVTSL